MEGGLQNLTIASDSRLTVSNVCTSMSKALVTEWPRQKDSGQYGYISSHCRVGLLHWRENVDFQRALDCDPAVRYTVT